MAQVRNFTDLLVWQKAHNFVVEVYRISQKFPKSEIYGLTKQLRDSSLSVTSNLAEGFGRSHTKEKLQFYNVSRASLAEAQSQILVARDINYMHREEAASLIDKSEETYKLINCLITSLSKKST
ncbi:MAG: four helix bundle protein [Candidatus Gracilibacteria bacterium]|nr:four helix bundle protein [Candidatus Gracilibacteria bacterium]